MEVHHGNGQFPNANAREFGNWKLEIGRWKFIIGMPNFQMRMPDIDGEIWKFIMEYPMDKEIFEIREGTRRYDLSERFLAFSILVIKIIKNLPNDIAGRRIGDQLFRSGTSPGANYEEARAAESKKDFIHKLGIVLKELRESHYWLKLINASILSSDSLVNKAIKECDELIRIIAASINKAKSHS